MHRTSPNTLSITNSVFFCITNTASGGAISSTNDNVELHVSSTSFSLCFLPTKDSSLTGGCIFYSSSLKGFTGKSLCASNCAAYGMAFLHILGSVSSKAKSNLTMTSYCYCANNTENSHYCVAYFKYKCVTATNINSTNNCLKETTVFGIEYPGDAHFSHGIFYNNTADALFCFWCPDTAPVCEKTAFIESKRLGNSYSVFHFSCSTEVTAYVKNCSFLNNHYNIFQFYNHVFEIIDCTVDEFTCDTAKGTLITRNIKTTNPDIYEISKHRCIIDINFCTNEVRNTMEMRISPLFLTFTSTA